LHRELLCGGCRCRSFGRRGACCNAVFLAPGCGRRGPATFAPLTAVAAAAAAALALVIAFARIRRARAGCRRASVFLWALLP